MADPTLVDGRTTAGGPSVPVTIMNSSVATTGGGGGSGDASAANQALQITAANAPQHDEDAAHSSGDKGILALGVRRDADTTPVSADGDYHAPIFDAAGNLKVNVKLGGSSTAAGDVAHDAVDSGNPVKVGGKASTALPAAVSNGDRVNAYFDEYGRLVVVLGTQLDATNDSVNAAKIAGVVPPIDGTYGLGTKVVPVGTQANAWSAAATGANGTSTVIDCQYHYNLSMFGNTSGSSVLTVQVSQDNSNFYDTTTTITANGNFHLAFTSAARYIRIKSASAVTATVTVAGKG